MEYIDILEKVNKVIVEDDVEKAIELICELIDEPKYGNLMYILIDAFQLYGFASDDRIKEFKDKFMYESFEIKLSTYKGQYLKYLNSGQLSLINDIKKWQKSIISAPTSFGKTSLVIEYIIQNLQHLDNIIFILPTKSLIEELYIKLLQLNKKIEYKYLITVNILKSQRNTIRILTPEKFLTYFEYSNVDNVDLIIMDEVYKIENDGKNDDDTVIDNRAMKFRKVLEIISKENKKIITLSPFTYKKEISMQEYMNKYNIKELNRIIKYVKHEYIQVSTVTQFRKAFSKYQIAANNYTNISNKTTNILKCLYENSNVIYVSEYSKIIDIIKEIKRQELDFLNKNEYYDRYKDFIKHLKETYNIENAKPWYIIEGLEKGIGIYISSMPRYVKKEIVNLFEKNVLKCLIVTTAFIEGVNSSADNIIITSGYTAKSIKLNDMALLNISGRAGRFGKKYFGNVYFLDENTYEKVKENSVRGVSIANPNYIKNNNQKIRDDFELEIIDKRFLNDKEKERIEEINELTKSYELNYEELSGISISAPNTWKILIYDFLNKEDDVKKYKEILDKITGEEDTGILEGIEKIFEVLKNADIPFKWSYNMVGAFSKNGEFIWGEMYKSHISGNIKKVLYNKKEYILKKRKTLTFFEFNQHWIKEYFKNNEFNDNKLYEETFKFIANIIEYKIPYYISLFASVYYFFINKNGIRFDENEELNIKEIIEKLENLGMDKEYVEYYDYGFSKDMVEKLKSIDCNLANYNIESSSIFDDYEKLMLREYKLLMGI
ncbi:MAG: DEAD/DEAH box helicase [Clostridia bacterium]|nr:DEAD/DEAH box helicase [Clostridia bacterium]